MGTPRRNHRTLGAEFSKPGSHLAFTVDTEGADGNGLYLVVDPSGAKRWVLRVVSMGKRCDLGLGGLSVVTLAEARD